MYVHLCCLNLPFFTYPRFDINRHTHSFFSFAILNQVAKLLINCNTHEYHGATWLQETCTRKREEIYCKHNKRQHAIVKCFKFKWKNDILKIYTKISNLNILKTIRHKKENKVEAHKFEEIYIKTKEHGGSFFEKIYNPQKVHSIMLKWSFNLVALI